MWRRSVSLSLSSKAEAELLGHRCHLKLQSYATPCFRLQSAFSSGGVCTTPAWISAAKSMPTVMKLSAYWIPIACLCRHWDSRISARVLNANGVTKYCPSSNLSKSPASANDSRRYSVRTLGLLAAGCKYQFRLYILVRMPPVLKEFLDTANSSTTY